MAGPTQLDIYQSAARLLADARFALITDDVETRYAFDDAWPRATAFVFSQAPWRVALKTVALSTGGSPALGYSNAYAFPADWLRTHAIFLSTADGREHPIDLKEQGAVISTNVAGPAMRYVSNVNIDPAAAAWPEHLAQCVAAYLAFLAAERVTGERSAPARMSELFSSLLPEAIRLDAVAEDPWLQHQRSGAFLRASRDLLRQANWRFALKDTLLTVQAGTPLAGLGFSYTIPADWLKTHKLLLLSGSRECPVDAREQAGTWSVAVSGATARYVSSTLALDTTQWPEPLRKAILAFLTEPDMPAPSQQQPRGAAGWRDYFAEAALNYAEPESPWLRFQLSGRFRHAAEEVLRSGFWRFAMRAVAAFAGGAADSGYTNSFTFPVDWVRTHAAYLLVDSSGRELPFDLRERGGIWSANVVGFTVRYVAAIPGLDPTQWTEPFTKAVLAFLAAEEGGEKEGPTLYQAALAAALSADSLPPNPWLDAQLDGTFLRISRAMADQGFWRFGMVTGLIQFANGIGEGGFSRAYDTPADWVRTRALFLVTPDNRRVPFDVRERHGRWFTEATFFSAEYLSTANLYDVTKWPDRYLHAVLRALELDRALRRDGGEQPPTYGRDYQQRAEQAAKEAASDILADLADGPDPWLPFQFDGTFERVARTMIDQGYWRFAMTTLNVTAPSGAGAGGFASAYTIPADWSRTRALYKLSADGRRCPFEVREEAGFWHTDAAGFYAQYVSETLAMDSRQWPDHYLRAVLRQLEFDAANRAGGQGQQIDSAAYKDALADCADSEADAPDPWLEHQLTGEFDRASRSVISRGYWWWALAEADISAQAAATPDAGFPYRFALPADWFKTHALFQPWDGAECPINIRESQSDWSTDAAFFNARYVTTKALDATTWPEIVGKAVLAYLQWQDEPATDKGGPGPKMLAYQRLLEDALQAYSRPEDPWLRHQLSGAFAQARKIILEKARWKFAVKSQLLETDDDPLNATITLAGTPHAGDVLTLTGANSQINGGTPVPVSATVQAGDDLTLAAARWANALNANAAFQAAGITFGNTGAVISIVLTKSLAATPNASLVDIPSAIWTVAASAGSGTTAALGAYTGPAASQGYAFRFPKPLDWVRTIRLWYSLADGPRPLWFDIDFRDEGGFLHANYAPLSLRYVSRAGLDATQWPAHYRNTVLAWLEHLEARGDAKLGSLAAERLKFFEAACEDAEALDDENEVPPVRTSGRFISGRYGRGGLSREQGLPPW